MSDRRKTLSHDEETDVCLDMCWLVAALAAVIIACTAGCTIAYVTHPREWVCAVADTNVCEKP